MDKEIVQTETLVGKLFQYENQWHGLALHEPTKSYVAWRRVRECKFLKFTVIEDLVPNTTGSVIAALILTDFGIFGAFIPRDIDESPYFKRLA